MSSRDTVRAEDITRAIASCRGAHVTATWPPERAVAVAREARAAVVVLDGFPPGAALRAMARATSACPDLGILVLGPLEPSVEVLIALASGASGYLPAGSAAVAVAEAVHALLAGEAVLPRRVSMSLVQHLRSGGRGVLISGADRSVSKLTTREWEILVLLRQGCGTADIARQLVLSKGTIRTHVSSLLRKVGAPDRRALGAGFETPA